MELVSKKEFLDILESQLVAANVDDVQSIIEVYEEHFFAGLEEGLSEAEIIKTLGTPEEIFQSYVAEGLITPMSNESQKINVQEVISRVESYREKIVPQLENYAAAGMETYKEKISPQLPEVGRKFGKGVAYVSYGMAILLWVGAILLVGGLWVINDISASIPMLAKLPPVPPMSTVTMGAIGGTGFFGGLAFWFFGQSILK